MADLNQFANLPDQQLEQALFDLGRAIDFPRTPDIAGAVRTRIDLEPAPGDRADNVRFLTLWRAVAVAAAVILLFLGAALIGLPDFRHAVADRLGVRGIKITFEEKTPTPVPTIVITPSPSPVGSSLLLGNRVTLEEAKAAVPFTLKVPTLSGVGEPDEVYLRTLPDGQPMVSFIYYPSVVLPETAETGAGALLMEFPTVTDTAMLSKGIGEGGSMIDVKIGDDMGYFVTGPSNLIMAPDPSQSFCCGEPVSRPSGNVLIWSHGDVTYRLESWLDSVDSVQFAESLQPAP
jgi:hypothetical protein